VDLGPFEQSPASLVVGDQEVGKGDMATPFLPADLGGNIVLLTQLHWPTVHPALQERRPPCEKMVYWWDGEYEGNCTLPRWHKGPHFDGLNWFNDDNEEVEPPCPT
jgi:hypothetical protein